jgi:hypothetical protein
LFSIIILSIYQSVRDAELSRFIFSYKMSCRNFIQKISEQRIKKMSLIEEYVRTALVLT